MNNKAFTQWNGHSKCIAQNVTEIQHSAHKIRDFYFQKHMVLRLKILNSEKVAIRKYHTQWNKV